MPFLPPYPENLTPADIEQAQLRRLNKEEFPSMEGVDPELMAIVLKACAPEKEDRYQDAQSMLEDLTGWQYRHVTKGRTVSSVNEVKQIKTVI